VLDRGSWQIAVSADDVLLITNWHERATVSEHIIVLTSSGGASFSDRLGKQHVLRGQPLLSQPLRWLAFTAALQPRLGKNSPVHAISADILEIITAQRLGRPPRRVLEKMIREVWAWRLSQLPHIAVPRRDHERTGDSNSPGDQTLVAVPVIDFEQASSHGANRSPHVSNSPVQAPHETKTPYGKSEKEHIAAAVSHFPAAKQRTLTDALLRMAAPQREKTILRLHEQRQEQLDAVADAEEAAAGAAKLTNVASVGTNSHGHSVERQQQVDLASRELVAAAVERGRRWQERALAPLNSDSDTTDPPRVVTGLANAAAAAADRLHDVQREMVLRQMVDMVRTIQ
jgi:hypothetical protein